MSAKYFITLLLIALHPMLHAQDVVISGTITSAADGNPLVGVKVSVKGESIATVSDFDGKYHIKASMSATLLFEHIGYKTQEIKVKGRPKIDIAMVAAQNELDEVVVTGYVSGVRMKSMVSTSVHYNGAPNYNTESYAPITENEFRQVGDNPLSTFSVDVDRASYSNIRRFINNGNMPPPDAVRIEEMINYFEYEYPAPTGRQPFSINTELATCPWNEDNLLLHIGLQGKRIPMDDLPPSNIVFLLDVSGSMNSPNKLPLLKSSLRLLLNELRDEDQVAIVVYAGSSGLVLDSTPACEKEKILEALDRLQAGGSTAGGAGLKLAYDVAEENFIKDGNNRILLATDGDFNIGQSSDGAMKRLIEEKREKGISISVLGYGMGNYKDSKMEIIADHGNGNYAYIDNLLEARKTLVKEFGGTFFTIAKDVKLQLEFNPAVVEEYRLVGYENRLLDEEDFEDDKKDAGDIGAGHSVTALYEIKLASGKSEKSSLKYQKSILTDEALEGNELVTIALRYKKPDGKRSKLIKHTVENKPSRKTSTNFKFAAAVAQFGMLLRDSEFKGSSNWDQVLSMARNSRGSDEEGYRGELIRLVETAKSMAGQ